MCKSEPFLVILCDTLHVAEVKVNFFTFEPTDSSRFLYISDASFSCKMLLKGVTRSRLKYFLLLATFAASNICTSYWSFSLQLPHIKQQYFKWEKISTFIKGMDYQKAWKIIFFNVNSVKILAYFREAK